MCLLCIDWEKGKLTAKEAANILGEMYSSNLSPEEEAHLEPISQQVQEKVIKEILGESDGTT